MSRLPGALFVAWCRRTFRHGPVGRWHTYVGVGWDDIYGTQVEFHKDGSGTIRSYEAGEYDEQRSFRWKSVEDCVVQILLDRGSTDSVVVRYDFDIGRTHSSDEYGLFLYEVQGRDDFGFWESPSPLLLTESFAEGCPWPTPAVFAKENCDLQGVGELACQHENLSTALQIAGRIDTSGRLQSPLEHSEAELAIGFLEAVVRRNPANELVTRLLASLCRACGHRARALELSRRTIELTCPVAYYVDLASHFVNAVLAGEQDEALRVAGHCKSTAAGCQGAAWIEFLSRLLAGDVPGAEAILASSREELADPLLGDARRTVAMVRRGESVGASVSRTLLAAILAAPGPSPN